MIVLVAAICLAGGIFFVDSLISFVVACMYVALYALEAMSDHSGFIKASCKVFHPAL